MSNGLVKLKLPGNANITAARPGPHSVVVPVTVNTSVDPLDPNTGVGIMYTDPRSVPFWFDYARRYTSDTTWRAEISSNLSTYSNPAKIGTGPSGNWPAAAYPPVRYGAGRYVDLITWLNAPDATYGPLFNEPCFEALIPGVNLASETPTPELGPSIRFDINVVSSAWLFRRKAMCSTPKFDPSGDADNTNYGQVYNDGGTLANAFTLTNAITSTGVQSVLVSNANNLGLCTSITIDTAGNAETFLLADFTRVDATHISANFTKTHIAGTPFAVTFGGQGGGWKSGPTITPNGTGGADFRLETTNWNDLAGYPLGQYIIAANDIVSTVATGVPENVLGNTDISYYTGALELEAVLFENWERISDHTFWIACTFYRKTASDVNWTQFGKRVISPTIQTSTVVFGSGKITSLNHNKSCKIDKKWWWTHGAYFDAEDLNNPFNADPGGIKAYFKTVMPESPTQVIVNTSSSTALNLTVKQGRFTGFLRAKIDGVWVTGQDYVIQREDGEYVHTFTGISQTGSIVMALSGLSLAVGSHTVAVFGISGNGAQIETTGTSIGFTI